MRCVAILLGMVLILALAPAPSVMAADMQTNEIYRHINDYRGQYGAESVQPNAKLEAAARAKLDNMIEEQYWGHFNSEGRAPWEFIAAEDYSVLHAGENLAIGFSDNKSLVHGWIKSRPHRENMLADYSHVGIAYRQAAIGGQHGIVVVAMFAEPQNPILDSTNRGLDRAMSFSRNLILAQPPRLLSFLR